jgi:hypothetical protein
MSARSGEKNVPMKTTARRFGSRVCGASPGMCVRNVVRAVASVATLGLASSLGAAGAQAYLSADGDLMPARKDQAPPDLRNFDRPTR